MMGVTSFVDSCLKEGVSFSIDLNMHCCLLLLQTIDDPTTEEGRAVFSRKDEIGRESDLHNFWAYSSDSDKLTSSDEEETPKKEQCKYSN